MDTLGKRLNSAPALASGSRFVFGSACAAGVLIVIVGAATIPFIFESQSILYKVGFPRVWLRCGKISGILAAVSVFFQILLVVRSKFLDRIFALDRLYRFHRIVGTLILGLALVHPLLIIAAENFTLFPLEMRYWPEFTGVAALVLLTVLVLTARWRTVLNWSYHRWVRFHRWVSPLALMLLLVHILFVSETFTSGPPFVALLVFAGLVCSLYARIWFRHLVAGRREFTVDRVTRVGRDTYALDISPRADRPFAYMPGQFAFIKPVKSELPSEEHPFTICSTPSRPDGLQFVIRGSGDWTSRIHRLQAGQTLWVDGPYGRFSYFLLQENIPIIMIAGGIGITPLLSMLRHMADRRDQRPLLLIWSNRTAADMVFSEEFQELTRRLKHLEIIHHLTRQHPEEATDRRLDRGRLETLLAGWCRTTPVFICAPPTMVRDMRLLLGKIGFSSQRVYKELFQF